MKSTALFLSLTTTILSSSVYAADPKITFYGTIDVFTTSSKAEGDSSRKTGTDSGGMSTSFIGVSTEVDLENGLKGTAVVESFLRPDTGDAGRFEGDAFFARDAYIGLKGGFGMVSMGRNTTPYFISIIITNPFVDSFGFSPSVLHSFLGGLQGDSGWSNSILYDSATISGLKVSLLHSFGEVAEENSASKTGFNVIYTVGDLLITTSFQTLDTITDDAGADPSDSQDAAMVGVSYDFGAAKLFGQLQAMSTETTAGDTDYDMINVGISVPIGKANILAGYATSDISATTDTKRDTIALGVDYVMSNKVDLYSVLYSDNNDSIDGTANSINFGGRVNF